MPAANPVLLSIKPGAIDLRAAINTGMLLDKAGWGGDDDWNKVAEDKDFVEIQNCCIQGHQCLCSSIGSRAAFLGEDWKKTM